MHTHSASRGGCVSPPSRSKPTIRKMRARRRTTARPMKPLLPVTSTTPAELVSIAVISSPLFSAGIPMKRVLERHPRYFQCSLPQGTRFHDVEDDGRDDQYVDG